MQIREHNSPNDDADFAICMEFCVKRNEFAISALESWNFRFNDDYNSWMSSFFLEGFYSRILLLLLLFAAKLDWWHPKLPIRDCVDFMFEFRAIFLSSGSQIRTWDTRKSWYHNFFGAKTASWWWAWSLYRIQLSISTSNFSNLSMLIKVGHCCHCRCCCIKINQIKRGILLLLRDSRD